jgi:bloom syndrome protein
MLKKDVMTVVGTGGGKSLTYLLPAVLSTKPTLVVSPVKSLIDDTLSRCQELSISVCKFTGDLPNHQREAQLQNFEHFKVVLVTPEMLKEERLIGRVVSLSDEGQLERIVFDEAHTIVNWGNTFRPVYKDICEKLSALRCPKLLLSATVPAKLETEIKIIFDNLTVLRSSIFRDNLQLNVKERTKTFFDEMELLLKEHKNNCGIIYCVMPNDVANIHAELVKRGFECVKYHGQLSAEVRASSYSKLMSGEAKIIVANSSFGMGIDKKDVRFIIHAHVPTSIDEYYQQCGRAGRDGLPAICILFYKYADKNNLFKLFKKQDNASVSNQMVMLNELVHFLENPVECRHKCLMLYFGENKTNFVCGISCDNCLHPGNYYLTDGTADALKVVHAMVELTGQKITETRQTR